MPEPAELPAMYDDAYFEDGGDWVSGFWRGSYAENEANLRAEAREMLPWLPPQLGRLLEIGCAGGFFLDEARALGWEVQGVELNRGMAEHARKMGLDVQCAPIETAELPHGVFNVVIAQDVLEHLCDVTSVTRRIAQLLAPGGMLIVRGPLEAQAKTWLFDFVRRLTGRGRILYEPPLHLQGFTERSFRALMRESGLVVDRLEITSYRRPLADWSVRELAAQGVETVGYAIDRLFHGGAFMIAAAHLPQLGEGLAQISGQGASTPGARVGAGWAGRS